MRTIFMLIAAVVLALLPAAVLCAAGPFITMESGSESVSLTAEEIRDGKEASIEADMEAATGASGPESVMFLLRRGSPNGTNLTAIYGNAGENLLGTLPPAMRGFDEYGELEEGYSLQVAVRDLNGDKKPDVLVATGDGAAVLTVAVFVYTPRGNERFRRIGVIEGQNSLHVDANGVISVPYGSQGLFMEYGVTSDGVLVQKR